MPLTDPYFMPEKKIGHMTEFFDADEISSSVSWEFPPFAIPGVHRLVVSFKIKRGGVILVHPYLAMHNTNDR